MTDRDARVEREAERMVAEYDRRRQVEGDRYAPWDPAEMLYRNGRRRVAAAMLHRAGVFPRAGDAVLEIGYGRLGWLGELIGWGLRARDLHGIELNTASAEVAQAALPTADLRIGDATDLPWPQNHFRLIVMSTVLTSVLDAQVRRRIASQAERVIAPGGALLWYDFRLDNPHNAAVRGIGRSELRQLFPGFDGEVRSVSLAPPLARRIAPISPRLASLAEALPFLRSHLLSVLVKPSQA